MEDLEASYNETLEMIEQMLIVIKKRRFMNYLFMQQYSQKNIVSGCHSCLVHQTGDSFQTETNFANQNKKTGLRQKLPE